MARTGLITRTCRPTAMTRDRATVAPTARGRTRFPAFSRSTWAAAIKEITDGTANTIAMGEVRPKCSGFLWYYGWVDSEGLWFATTAPINFPTCPDEQGVPDSGATGCNDYLNSWNTAMGFKSCHPGGAQFVFCDGSGHFLADTIDHTVYQCLGDRHDGQTIPLNY